jgi:hypothetical protein
VRSTLDATEPSPIVSQNRALAAERTTTRPRWLQPLLYVVLAVLASAPAWVVAHPPIQDLPYHLATIRVIHSLNDPAYGLGDFVLTLRKTQYVGYYLMADWLAYVFGVKAANTLLVATYFAGTVLGLRALLRALNCDARLCLFALPLLVNRLFLIGLLPFLLGIPVLFFALAVAVRFVQRRSGESGAAWGMGIGALTLGLFSLHVVPFGLFLIGFLAMVFARPLRTWPALAWPLCPAAVTCLWWLSTAAAKKRYYATSGDNVPFATKLTNLPYWLADNFRAGGEGWILTALAALAIVAVALALREERQRGPEWGLALVPLACVALYFGTVERQEYLWPIAGRFPSLCLLTAIPFLRMPAGARGVAVASCALALGALSLGLTCARFVQFERDELGDLEGAIGSIPPRMHVAAVLGGSRSTIVTTTPLLHAGSYYQLEKGGVVAFSFAGYPHWPIAFREGAEPPTGPAFPVRWEWQPHTTSELSPYYDYVITRGIGWGGPEYALHFSDSAGWRVWRRITNEALR